MVILRPELEFVPDFPDDTVWTDDDHVARYGGCGVAEAIAGMLQGLGYVGGSSMSGSETWAVIGPAFAGLGVALVWVALQRRRP